MGKLRNVCNLKDTDMTSQISSDNKRIAKNTLLLYARMLYSLFISLFTSRVILAALGFEDYGLYNVIGSVVTMFVFLRSAMGNSVDRFITYSIGKGDETRLGDIFSMSLMIHTGLAVLIVILCETAGLWFLNTQMIIPAGREIAANWVFQFSIIACALSVICVPYDAEIIAHEKLGIFAFIQILQSTLNLAIVFAVKYYSHDKLILYAFLLLMVQVINRIIYGIYCGRNFPETKFHIVKDKGLFKEMMGFAGWSLIGNMAYIGYTQGLNLILNVFFGPAVNAARGIAFQVQGAIKGFVTNFQMAVNPQITKSYAQGDYSRLHSLIYTSSKFSYFLLLCMVLPVAIESDTILHAWLGEIPEYTIPFVILTLSIMLLDPLSNPIGVANNATGTIKSYQLVEGGTLLLIVPIAYIVVKFGGDPISVFIVQLIIVYFVQVLRLFLVCHKIHMSIRVYCQKIIFKIVIVTVVSIICPLCMYNLLDKSILSCIFIIIASVISVLTSSYLIGCEKHEKDLINTQIGKIFNNFKNYTIKKRR